MREKNVSADAEENMAEENMAQGVFKESCLWRRTSLIKRRSNAPSYLISRFSVSRRTSHFQVCKDLKDTK